MIYAVVSTDGPSTRRPVKLIGPRVLVIEDHQDSRDLLVFFLELKGCEVLAAENGELALALTDGRPPDLIIMNISWPAEEGLEMLRQLYAHYSFQRVPIIVTSGFSHPAFRVDVLRAGCSAFFAKPIELEELDIVMKHCLDPSSAGH
jgi:DNA-binding response OmpR family regulator